MNNQIVNERKFTLNDFYARIYALMGMGITVSAVVSFLTLTVFQANMVNILNNHFWILPVTWVLELVVVFALSSSTRRDSSLALPGFIFYSALNGFTLSFTLAYYQLGSVTQAFVVAAVMFFALAFYGSRTKQSLTGVGKAARAGLIGLILAGIVFIFTGGQVFNLLISFAGVLIFSGLIAYDNQTIKNVYNSMQGDVTDGQAISLALSLYLDFINLFIYLLRIFGNKD
ncbi:Bax inhibitor-1/YccA family protein [Streptococcaceae bacterium ESL0687]|nr:Bax inhibitor-1/YccA family protein [Streptococcaceae bacterium ESL0687]